METLAFVIVALFAAYVAVEGGRALVTPTRWPSSTNRWVVSLRWPRDPPPALSEIRFWGAVWTTIGVTFAIIAVAAIATA